MPWPMMATNSVEITVPSTPPTRKISSDKNRPNSAPLLYTKSIRRLISFERSFSVDSERSLEFASESLRKAVDRNDYSLCVQLLQDGVPVDGSQDVIDGKENYTTPLILAAQKRHQHIISLLLKHNANVNAKTKNKQTALHFVAKNNDAFCCPDLLNVDGIDVLTKDTKGDTPLHLAVRHNSFDVCKNLLEKHCETVKQANRKGHTPLHVAAMVGNAKILSILIECGADPEVRDTLWFIPLHYSAQRGHSKCCEILISRSRESGTRQARAKLKDGRTPLMLAAANGYHRCCSLMTDADVSCSDNEGDTALHHAVKGRFHKNASVLLEKGADPNARNKLGNTPLLIAVVNKTPDCTKSCLENGGDVKVKNDKGETVLHVTALKGSDQNMEYLLAFDEVKEIVDALDGEGYTALHYAILKKSPKCSHLLLNHGASVNIPTRTLMTPLHLAAKACNTELCELFLGQKGIQVNQDNADMEKPLHLAARSGSADCCNLLLRKGAQISVHDAKGRAPIHLAAEQNEDCLQLLTRKGAMVKAKDYDDMTALHYAAKAGTLNCCVFLVRIAKYLLWEETGSARLPLDVAFCKNHDEMFGYLMRHMNWKKGQTKLEIRLHDYMHRAIVSKRILVIEAIVESTWWQSAFKGHRGPCQNFIHLIEHYPRLAKQVMDKCYNPVENSSDLTIVENGFYENSVYTGRREMNPFDHDTGKLRPSAHSFYENENSWREQNAITKMILHKRKDLLLHPVTRAWVLNRWNAYAKWIFIVHLALEVLLIILMSSLASSTRSWSHMSLKRDVICALSGCCLVDNIANVTEAIRCSNTSWEIPVPFTNVGEDPGYENASVFSYSVDSEKPPPALCSSLVPQWTTAAVSLTVMIIVLLLVFLAIEVIKLRRLQRVFFSLEYFMRWVRILLAFGFILPFTKCCLITGIKEDGQWISGVMAMLLEGLFLINALNKFPKLSVFLPVTKDFVQSYLKGVAYILALILLFAFIFHLLMWDQKPFHTVPQAIMRTIVLMLGDYNYDTIFLKNVVAYPVIANFLFVFFITIISGFLVNIIVTKEDNVSDNFRLRATLHRAISNLEWILTLDICLPFLRKKHSVGKYVDCPKSQLEQWQQFFSTEMIMQNKQKDSFKLVHPVKEEHHQGDKEILQALLELARDHKNQLDELRHEIKTLKKLTKVDAKTATSPTKSMMLIFIKIANHLSEHSSPHNLTMFVLWSLPQPLWRNTKPYNGTLCQRSLSAHDAITTWKTGGEEPIPITAKMKQDNSMIPLTSPSSSPPVKRTSGLQRTGGMRKRLPALVRALSMNDEARPLVYTYEALLNAVDREDYDICNALLSNGVPADPPEQGRLNTTPLILASQKGFQNILRLLILYEAKVNAKNKNEQTALHFAARRNDLAICQELLDADGIDVCAKDKQHDTPLHVAVRHNNLNVCHALLEHDSTVLKCVNKKGHAPLHTAAMGGHDKILKFLVENDANWDVCDKNWFLPLHYAAQRGHTECCRILIEASGDNEPQQVRAMLKDGRTPLMLAAKGGYNYCCDLMQSADICCCDREGNTALHLAVMGDFDKTVSSLLSRGADPYFPNKQGNTPLHEAVSNKTSNCIKLCINNQGNIQVKNKKMQSVLHIAALKCSDQNLEYLLNSSTNLKGIIDDKDKEGFTALHYAIMKRSVTCVQLLITAGASVNITTKQHMTSLHLAADACNTQLCELFLSLEASQVNQENGEKELPLHLAASRGSVQCCNILLRKGSMVSGQDSKGRTPVHLAAQKNHMECIQLLARKGAFLRAKDNEGRTALHYAAESGSLNSCRILVHNAKSLLWEDTEFNILPLDIAFRKKKDEVFRFMMQKLVKKDSQEDLEIRIHDYMHCAIPEERMVAIEAIVDSAWWKSAFTGHRGPCQNFSKLVEDYPLLAKKVMDKCCTTKRKFDFTLIDNDFYVLSDSKRKRVMNPFDPVTGKLPKNTRSFYKNDYVWCQQNVLTKMVQKERKDLLLHPVIKAWILNRWNSYAQKLFILYLIIETIFASVLSTQVAMSRNWIQQDMKKELVCSYPRCFKVADVDCIKNVEDNLITGCPDSWNNSLQENEESTKASQDLAFDTENVTLTFCTSIMPSWTVTDFSLSGVLAVLLSIYLLVEFNCMVKLKRSYWSLYCCLRWLRLIMTAVFLVPFTWCNRETGIKEDWQWVAGIVAVLLEWLLLLNALNRLPFLSVFMPVTRDFLWSYLKIITYIFALIVLFAFIFHLLLWNQRAFVNVPQAVVKTLVLMLGDYGYDDLFFGDDPVAYPITANVFFVIFITTIGGFIVNLVITKPDDVAESFRSRATLHRAATSVSWILTLDVCLPMRKTYAIGYYTDILASQTSKWQKFVTNKMLMLSEDKELEEEEARATQQEEIREMLQMVLDLAKDQKNQIDELKHELKALQKTTNADAKSPSGAAKVYK
ncbi:uncharacterized protein LOC143021130 [Oratosquilla oratoria]|uniref:uncharacterized protein LOC143021130 n=1 Tax=Oratosquilla oratoria TaxID=337810 RepID=UPI003F771E00